MPAIRQRHYLGRWLTWFFLATGLMATMAAWWAGQAMIDRKIAAQLNARVTYAKNSLKGQISAYTEVLRGYQAQFTTHAVVSAAAFAQTSNLLDLERRLPGILAVGFSPRAVPDETFLIQYIEPLAKNTKAPGFDQVSNAKRYAAIHRARDTGVLLSLLTFLFMRTLAYAQLASDARTQKAEQSLHSSERQLAEVMASINEVLWTSHFPGSGVAYVSPAVERVYGYPVSAFYKRPRLWLACIHRQVSRVNYFGRCASSSLLKT